ncbi:NAD(P)-dependent oxidoreductase [Pelagibacterium montanilacus]|uniref:NAD(P)-dependent oxidoreductase n=1 Tax=Pelagibacterium montanilacus TaxID=2185280 RepID=UPI000F8D5F49|nr:NAD(P)-dependent oxidoreductase [Pelagibacterium montanilacus]
MGRILITPRSLTANPPPALDALREAGHELVFAPAGKTPSEADLLALVPGCTGWLAGVEPVSDAVIAAADALAVISRNGTGIDNLPRDAIAARGIEVRRAPAANAIGVAELAIGLMIALCRHLPRTATGVARGDWPRMAGREIAGTTVGVIGLGAIGRKVARILVAMDAKVIAHDPFAGDLGPLAGAVTLLERDAVFSAAEIVTLHCPMPEDGRALIDAEAIGRLGPDALVVNTARAGLVEAAALVAALEEGRLAGYGTDVFDPEPPTDLAIAGHPKVIATSHIGGLTRQSVERATRAAIDNLLDGLGAR